MTTARIVRRFNLLGDGDVSYEVEIREIGAATRRWPTSYASHDEAMVAATRAGVDVLAGWCDEYG